MSLFLPVGRTFKSSWRRILAGGLLFAVAAQLLQLILLVVRFGEFPNYMISYDWIANTSVIVNSTPSVRDMLTIIFEEWWIEIGFMNYDYGNGISEWSLNVIPSRLVMLSMMGGMLVLLFLLQLHCPCRAARKSVSRLAGLTGASVGTVLMCMTSAAMSWVVCCATPSWVVGLAMLGLGVSTSLALENLGPALFYSGFALLAASILLAARRHLPEHESSGPVDRDSVSSTAQGFPLPLTRI